MDSDALVDFQIDAGDRLVAQLVHDGVEVGAAFWVKTAEEGIWFLYVATPLVEQRGLAESYRVLQASLQRLPGIPLSLSDVKLTGVENPIARDVLAILDRFSGRMATRYGGKQLGNMTIESAYLYPSHDFREPDAGRMSREDVLQELVRLMDRGPGILQPSRVKLRDGGAFEGIPFAIQTGSHRAMMVQFIDNAEPAPRVVNINEIESILPSLARRQS